MTFDAARDLPAVERKLNFMIRSVKALLLVLTLGCVSFAQTPGGTANPPDSDNKAGAYYHFAMGRLYAELAGSSGGQREYVNKAIQHYQDALKLDPSASIIFEELTDLYVQTGRLQDAIAQAEDQLKQNPDNLDARRMLARIYMRATQGPQEGRIDEAMLRRAIEQYQKITEKDPKDTESWVILGRLFRVSNSTAESEKAYNAALQADPGNEDALTGLAMMYSDSGDSARAIEKLKAATEKNPNERTLTTLAQAYERSQDFKNAAETLTRALELAPDKTDLKVQLAQDLLYSDQIDDSLKLYQELAAEEPKEAVIQLRIAEIYRTKGDLAKAREALGKAKQLDAGDLEVGYEEVNLLEAEGKNDEAITQLKALLEDTSRKTYSAAQVKNRVALLNRLGQLYRTSGQTAQAVETFRQLGVLDASAAPRATVMVVETYRLAKDFPNAQREADAALKKYPDERMVRVAHAELLSDMGKIDEAAAEITALPKGDSERENLLQVAQIYEKGKRWAEMGKALDAAEKLSDSDDDKETVWFMRGAMLERMKKLEEAESWFRKVLQTNPKNAGALNYLGYMLADRAIRLDEAHDLIQKALELEPQNGAYLDSMGWLYFRQGKLTEAEDLLVRASDRLRQDPTVHDHLGDVYFKLGKTKEAIAQWQVSLKQFQSGPQSDNDPDLVAKVSKKLESARVRLAKETPQKK